jgi:predicted PurR-regulated permease PerM
LLGTAALIGAVVVLVVPQFLTQARDFVTRLPVIVAAAEHALHLHASRPPTFSRELSTALQSDLAHPDRVQGPALQLVGSVLGILAVLVLIVLAATFMALKPEPLLAATLRLLPAAHRARTREVLDRIRTAWLGWLTAVGIDMLLLGGLLFAGLTVVGVPFALGFAVFSALMTVIPNYGSIISAVPPVLVGLAHSPTQGLLVVLVYVIVNQIEGNLILPLVMARTVDLHPALVAIGVLVMAQLFGLIGVIVAIPLLSLFIILVEELWIKPQEAGGLEVVGESAPGEP